MKAILLMATFLFMGLAWSSELSGFKGVYAGQGNACAHTETQISCWGSNFYGQTINLEGFSGIKKLALSTQYGCVVDEIGLSCWGNAPQDISSDLSVAPDITDVVVEEKGVCVLIKSKVICSGKYEKVFSELDSVDQVAITLKRICIRRKGAVTCATFVEDSEISYYEWPKEWGVIKDFSITNDSYCALNTQNELICGASEQSSTRERLSFNGVKSFAGDLPCALGSEGEFWCRRGVTFPTGMGRIQQADAHDDYRGEVSYCALGESNNIHCWGKYHAGPMPPVIKGPELLAANIHHTYISLKSGEIVSSGAPATRLKKNIQTKKLSLMKAGFTRLCFIDEDGPRCTVDGLRFEKLPSEGQIVDILPANDSVCLLYSSGNVTCAGDRDQAAYASQLKNITKIVQTSHSRDEFCALDRSNMIHCWGKSEIKPAYDPSLKIRDIAGGDLSLCLLFEDESIRCWGPADPDSNPPAFLEGMTHVIGGGNFFCAHNKTELFCWGKETKIKNPPRVQGKIKSITAGDKHACFIDDEKVKCWGDTGHGQDQMLQD